MPKVYAEAKALIVSERLHRVIGEPERALEAPVAVPDPAGQGARCRAHGVCIGHVVKWFPEEENTSPLPSMRAEGEKESKDGLA